MTPCDGALFRIEQIEKERMAMIDEPFYTPYLFAGSGFSVAIALTARSMARRSSARSGSGGPLIER
jgi:hypothetical protein